MKIYVRRCSDHQIVKFVDIADLEPELVERIVDGLLLDIDLETCWIDDSEVVKALGS